jgi:hypothetical protein
MVSQLSNQALSAVVKHEKTSNIDKPDGESEARD